MKCYLQQSWKIFLKVLIEYAVLRFEYFGIILTIWKYVLFNSRNYDSINFKAN